MKQNTISQKTLMLWIDDFKAEKAWKAICEILNVPDNTKEIELHVSSSIAFPYVHKHGFADKKERM